MFEALIGFFVGILTSWYILPFIFLGALYFESRDARTSAGFFTLLIFAGLLLMFPISWATFGLIATGYFPAGLLWSFWRYRKYVKKGSEKILDGHRNSAFAPSFYSLRPEQNIGKISYWVVFWPISFVENLLSGVIDIVEHTIRTSLKSVYNSIYNSIVEWYC